MIKRHAQAKHLKLKFCPYRSHFIATAPPHVRDKTVQKFLLQHQEWIEKQMESHSPVSSINIGDRLSVLGDDFYLQRDPLRKRGVWLSDGVIWIGGRESIDSLDPLVPWLKKQAHAFFSDAAQEYAQALNVHFTRVSIKETVSRWGSCSSKGVLSFNWRLVLSPLEVAHYVCAHEVCHLVEMNHSDRFWSLVEQLCPNYRSHRLWLKKRGAELYHLLPSKK